MPPSRWFWILMLSLTATPVTGNDGPVPNVVLAVHGGLGESPGVLTKAEEQQVIAGIEKALRTGHDILMKKQGTALDAIEAAYGNSTTQGINRIEHSTIARPDHSAVSGATIVIAQPGGLSVTTTSTLEGTFGPVLLEAGDYTVTAVASAGSDWLPGRAGRVSFAPGEPPVAETGTVDLTVLAAGGTVQARVTRAASGGAATLATGKVILNGQGQVITATAFAAVLPGQDDSTGPNVTIAAPAGIYVLTVVPDDGSLTPPDPLTIQKRIDGVRLRIEPQGIWRLGTTITNPQTSAQPVVQTGNIV